MEETWKMEEGEYGRLTYPATRIMLVPSDKEDGFSMRSTCDSSIDSLLGYLAPAGFENQWREQQARPTNIHDPARNVCLTSWFFVHTFDDPR